MMDPSLDYIKHKLLHRGRAQCISASKFIFKGSLCAGVRKAETLPAQQTTIQALPEIQNRGKCVQKFEIEGVPNIEILRGRLKEGGSKSKLGGSTGLFRKGFQFPLPIILNGIAIMVQTCLNVFSKLSLLYQSSKGKNLTDDLLEFSRVPSNRLRKIVKNSSVLQGSLKISLLTTYPHPLSLCVGQQTVKKVNKFKPCRA